MAEVQQDGGSCCPSRPAASRGRGRAGPPWPPLLPSPARSFSNGMDVRAANASGEDCAAVEVFTVEVARGTWPDTAKLRETWPPSCRTAWPSAGGSSERERTYPLRRGLPPPTCFRERRHRRQRGLPEPATQFRGSPVPPDEIGLLHRITWALFDAGLDVVSARGLPILGQKRSLTPSTSVSPAGPKAHRCQYGSWAITAEIRREPATPRSRTPWAECLVPCLKHVRADAVHAGGSSSTSASSRRCWRPAVASWPTHRTRTATRPPATPRRPALLPWTVTSVSPTGANVSAGSTVAAQFLRRTSLP